MVFLRKPHSWALSLTAIAVSWAVCHSLVLFPSIYRCNTLAIRTSVLLRRLLDLDTYGGVDPLDAFPLFEKKVADIIAPKLRIIFRRLIRLGSFPECWRSANVTAIPKGDPSPDRENYRPISITFFF